MVNSGSIENFDDILKKRTQELFLVQQQNIYKQTDRLFVGLMLFQWIAGIIIAFTVSPKTWIGAVSQTHVHVWAAIFLGGGIAIFPILLGIYKPGHVVTRNVIAVSQMLFSALLIHLTGGRIETHFHVFGSMAFLAFYRDWRILVPAAMVVIADHMLRGLFWPQSVFGVLTASHWLWVEHAAWVIFEDIFLIRSCVEAAAEMKRTAENTAELELNNKKLKEREADLDRKIRERTENFERTNSELKAAHDDLKANQQEVMALFKNAQTINKKLKETQSQLVQSEKMASIGQLAAGVAHEINNPVGFINNNMEVLREYIMNYADVLKMTDRIKEQIRSGDLPKARVIADELSEFEKHINLEFVRTDINKLLDHSLRGLERIRKIVFDLRVFARDDQAEMTEEAKAEEIIDSILSIVQNEVKYKAELVKEYGKTSAFKCSTQKLGQVFINLLVNASQAMEERGKITIKTYQDEKYVYVEIIDTGKGIPAENLDKVFDPFFTTKPVGQGTGLGLSVSYEIIKSHKGELKVKSKPGEGTTFTVMLPLAG